MTDLNTLKNWFKTGLKPTQEQFAAWMNSFFHKGEKIPQSSIDGLDTTLGNKADADQLKNKADLVGGKIPLAQMPFADDVLEFPAQSNFPAQGAVGKIYLDLAADKPFVWDSESGTYKPAGGDDLRMAQIEQNLANEITNRTDADAGKVDKPTADGNWVMKKLGSVFSWVDASNFGKNVANTLLDTIANAGVNMKANWRIVTNNFSLSIEGLFDKSDDPKFNQIPVLDGNGNMAKSNGKAPLENLLSLLDYNKDANGSYIAGYNEYLAFNPITKKLVKTDRPQIVATNNFPSNITVNYPSTIANSNYVPNPTTPADIAETYNMIKDLETGYQFTKFLASEILFQKMPVNKYPASLQGSYEIPDMFDISDGAVLTKKSVGSVTLPIAFSNFQYRSDMENSDIMARVLLNRPMPTDRDWIIKIRHYGSNNWAFGNPFNSLFGFVPSNDVNLMDYRPAKDWLQNAQGGFGRAGRFTSSFSSNTVLYFMHKGSKLSLLIFNEVSGAMNLFVYDYDSSNDIFFRFGWVLDDNRGYNNIGEISVKDISYWTQP